MSNGSGKEKISNEKWREMGEVLGMCQTGKKSGLVGVYPLSY